MSLYDNAFVRSQAAGGAFLSTTLPSAAQMVGQAQGVLAYTTDNGLYSWNGTTWTQIPVISGTTGTGAIVLQSSPTLITPTLGVATATSINGSTIPTNTALGYLGLPQNAQVGNYTLALTDQGKCIQCTNTGAQAITIPANASIAFPVGSTISGVNLGTTSITIPITSDTLYWLPSGGNGTRTVAVYGIWTLLKVAATTWVISGQGIT